MVKNNIEITDEFKQAFNLLENSSESLFITGKAGTGKSTFLEYFRRKSKKNIVVVAPTGVAALNVRGQTIHSFFRLRPGFIDIEAVRKKPEKKAYTKLEVLIIDEISMVRADIFDAIEKFLRLNGPKKGEPFGGVQICVIGDLYQLPPIISRDESEIYHRFYSSPFFFCADSYDNANFNYMEFSHIFRQTEGGFINLLNKIRAGERDRRILDYINQRYVSESELEGESTIVLTTTNRIADNVNNVRLSALSGTPKLYDGDIEGDFNLSGNRLPAPEQLSLKVGSQVMFTKNDQSKRWVNGTIGTVVGMSGLTIDVAIRKTTGVKTYKVEREIWESIKYEFDVTENKIIEKVTGEYRQFPLMLAWAVTIHKSQGKTLDSVIIDLGRGAFAAGQLYVALSRCRTFNKIILRNKVNFNDIICDNRVIEFCNKSTMKIAS